MMIRDDAAGTKRCCGPSGCGIPEMAVDPAGRYERPRRFCIGQECMAWRWAYGDPASRGFCGLAGTGGVGGERKTG